MTTSDVLIIGGGVIGLTLALELRRAGASVTVLEAHQPGREASWAAGGMIAHTEAGPHPLLRRMAEVSSRLYPTFVQVLEDESGRKVDLRSQGTIRFQDEGEASAGKPLSSAQIRELEPGLTFNAPAVFLDEHCVDPRLLMEALIEAAKRLGVEVVSGAAVTQVAAGVAVTAKSHYTAKAIVNCAGAWSAQFSPVPVQTRPVKGQMLAVIPNQRDLVSHVVRGNGIYLIPRSDGKIVIGSTIEDVGFDKRVEPATIRSIYNQAIELVPALSQARMAEDWAGLRPGTPDKLPIMGETSHAGYFVATGHYRDGIMLAPITARLMSQLILGHQPDFNFDDFSPRRFA